MNSFKQKKMRERTQNVIELFSRRRPWIRLLVVFAGLLALIYIRYAAIAPINHDEVEHAHAAFKILNGSLPYRDFYQNHLPAYWLLNMQFVRMFPFSVNAILAARAVNLLALAACWILGFRLLKSIRGGRTWLGLSVYTCALITLVAYMDFHHARPDPVMVLIGTAGLCLIPAGGGISAARAMLLGMLFGLSLSVSTKILPVVLVVPALTILHCIRDRRLRPAVALFPYGLFVVLFGLLPTAFWVFHNRLLEAFYFDVFDLNRALSKPWHRSLDFLVMPLYLVSAMGALILLGTHQRRSNRHANGPLVLALTLAAGIALSFIARHVSLYNLQILIIPLAVGFVSFLIQLCLRTRGPVYQMLLCAALLGYPIAHASSYLLIPRTDRREVPKHELQSIMDLAKPAGRTCTAFAPHHPVFCRDVSGLSNGWDLFFAEKLHDPRQLERFRKLWRDGIRRTLKQPPDIILRKSEDNYWERAVKAGLVTLDELKMLDALHSSYEVRHIGNCEVWTRTTTSE